MKTRFIKGITAVCFIAALLFSSCLKDDSHYFNPSDSGTIFAEFPLGGLANFGSAAVTKAGIDTIQFALNIASANSITTPITATLAVDNTIVTAYNTANPNSAVSYIAAPSAAIKLTTNYTVPVGIAHSVTCTIIIDRTQLDPTLSYMIPVKIASSSASLSSNNNVFYFHIIGNDFAGTYVHDFTRTPPANFTGHIDTFFPDSPTQFEVVGGYYTALIKYVVSFTKTGTGTSATYSNFAISINPSDVAILTGAGIAITTQPSIVGYTAGTQYTKAQVLQLFANGFTYQVLGGSGARTNLDQYHQ